MPVITDLKTINTPIQGAPYEPDKERQELWQFIQGRTAKMKTFRKSLRIETEWRDADVEYLPLAYEFANTPKRLELDQDTGLRSRLVPIGSIEDDWRSTNADPTLLVKIQIALSIIIDQNPEAIFEPLNKIFEGRTAIANALWKRSWSVTNAKEVYRLFLFNLFKYGWAVGRTFPKEVKYEKRVLTELNKENPEQNKFVTTENVLFRDVSRENMDPFRTWIDEMTKPYDQFSMNDCYYEIDYGYDAAKAEYEQYKHWDSVVPTYGPSADEKIGETTKIDQVRSDVVTIGIYENRLRDIYAITVPKQGIILYQSPLPNDDGYLSLWHSHLYLRDAKNPFGVSIWRIIKQNKELRDKMKNMTMDQLVLSIMKMFFYTGSSNLFNDGRIRIAPGKGYQIVNGKIDWLDVPGPGEESWKGLDSLQQQMDSDSGITPTLEGDVTGKTLGEILHAKESALKRLKMPLQNVAFAIEQDAYVSLSWMTQVYSTPEVKEFASPEAVQAYEDETGKTHDMMQAPQEEGGSITATYLPQLSLGLSKQGNNIVESKQANFFQVGKDLPLDNLKWRGIIKVVPKSILAPSLQFEQQRKIEIFNILGPILAQPPELYAKAATQLLKVNEEDPKDWLPDSWLQTTQPQGAQGQPLFVPNQGATGGGQPTGQLPMTPGGQSQQGMTNTKPLSGGPTIVPRSQVPSPQIPGFNAKPYGTLTPR